MGGKCPYDYGTCLIGNDWFTAEYQVLDTDYENYTVIWGCGDMWIGHTPMAWLLTRERHGADIWKAKAHDVYHEKVPKYDWQGRIYNTKQDESCKYHDEIQDIIDE